MEAEPRRKLYFTSQGFRSQEIVVAPELDDSQSKRKPLIAQEDVTLDENIHDLDDGTKRRNRAFQERIDSIWRSTAGWEAKLKTEAKEAVETILNMKDNYAAHISDFRRSLFSEVNEIFDKVDNQSIPSEIDRADVIDKNAAVFVAQTVPDTIERQSGEVSRQLRRTYETFDIEKKKELKRETKLVEKGSRHFQNTAQRFDDEDALMDSCFFNLEDDVLEQERRASRLHLIRNRKAFLSLQEGNTVSEIEAAAREREDEEVLDTVIETQGLLQQMVLLHFGTKEVDFSEELDRRDEEREKKVFPKLHKRLEGVHRRKKKLLKTAASRSASNIST